MNSIPLLVFTWSFFPVPGSEFRSPIISQNCFSSPPPTWPFYSTLDQQPTYIISCRLDWQECVSGLTCDKLHFEKFEQICRIWSVPCILQKCNTVSDEFLIQLWKNFQRREREEDVYQSCQNLSHFPFKIKLVFCSTGFPFQTFMWNIQSPENISSEHICVFALLMMFRQKFWDQGHTHQEESVTVSRAQKSKFKSK